MRVKNEFTSDLNREDFHSNKRVRLVDEKDDCFEYHDEGQNKESTHEGNKYKGNIACDSRSSKYSFGGLNKGKEKVVQPVVHNTRKRAELSKTINSNE
ncbi:12224_t:CDS:2 [Gigaspora margarita]|uniref:12224_t:CDS:1 n=1 Tax=Gigaspora margarita TaxID=4874 RepID=A0ABN7UKX7_GIGMA|nr:12224_t:CDS:2 [Gigaspora margarita]